MKSSEDTITEFFASIKEGKSDRMLSLLEDDPSLLNAYDNSNFEATPINVAIYSGNKEMIDVLLDHGADINRKSNWWAGGFAPIHTAIDSRDTELAEHLISRGAIVDIHAAAGLGKIDMLKDMLGKDPELVHQKGGDGQTPLHYAKNQEVVDILLAHGANIDALDVDHVSSPAQWAVVHRPEVTRYLLSKGAHPDIMMLAAVGDAEGVRQLGKENPSLLEIRIGEGTYPTPGSEALHIFGYTLGYNATPIHVAARFNQVEVIKALLDLGVDKHITGDYDDSTPLHTAAWHEHLEAAELLLQNGADLERPSGELHGNTPLGWAIVGGAFKFVHFALEKGAKVHDYHIKDAESCLNGNVEYSRATPEAYVEIVALLKEHS